MLSNGGAEGINFEISTICSLEPFSSLQSEQGILSQLTNCIPFCILFTDGFVSIQVDICAVDGALVFLIQMLSYKAPSKTLAIIENAGGILRNISSHVAVREDYR